MPDGGDHVRARQRFAIRDLDPVACTQIGRGAGTRDQGPRGLEALQSDVRLGLGHRYLVDRSVEREHLLRAVTVARGADDLERRLLEAVAADGGAVRGPAAPAAEARHELGSDGRW